MPGLFDDSELDSYGYAQENPAAPTGMGQAAKAAERYNAEVPGYENSKLGANLDQYGFTDTARSWYTGANQTGEQNGWDNTFVEKFIAGQEQAGQDGTLGTYFTDHSANKATGVVTWDHESEDGVERFNFGDVYEDGVLKGNLYDQFDRDTANLMMSDWLFDGESKAKIFAESDAVVDPNATGPKLTHLDDAVEEKRQQNNVDIPKALSAANFQQQVKDTQQEFLEGDTDLAIAAGGAAGGAGVGAGTGAAVGAFFFGVGAAPGAAVGATVGGLVGGLVWRGVGHASTSAISRAK